MIPQIIHYCWFGKTQKNDVIKKCIESWHKTCPTFVIKEWNEENYNISSNPFVQRMYKEKKWAFVADYVRLEMLQKEGGFYLDADMLLLKSLSPLCNNVCVLGEEKSGIISAGMIGVTKDHPYITKVKDYYDNRLTGLETIPRILTKVYEELEDKKNIIILPPETFYPFDQNTIGKYRGQSLGDEVYGVHLWNYSWGHPLNKLFKKLKIHSLGVRVVEALGVKKILKKILGFI